MRYKLLILYLLIACPSAILAESPRLKYSTLLGETIRSDRNIAADVDSEGNFYVFVPQMASPDSTWTQYEYDVGRLLRINHDGSGVDLVSDIPRCRVFSLECHPSGFIYLEYYSWDEGTVLKKINHEGNEICKLEAPRGVWNWGDHFVDADGNLYLFGHTNNLNEDVIPITDDAMFPSPLGSKDIFIMRYNTSFELEYCSFLGGNASDYAVGIIGNTDGNILLACDAISANFPFLPNDAIDYTSPAILIFNPGLDEFILGFYMRTSSDRIINFHNDLTYDPCTGSIYDVSEGVSKFSSLGEFQWFSSMDRDDSRPFTRYAKIARTYENDYRYESIGIALDETGNIYYNLDANDDNFPVTPDALYSERHGGYDITVNRINSDGVHEYATYFGGSGDEYSWPLATACNDGVFYCAGITRSADFPTTPGAYMKEPLSYYYHIFAFAIDFNDFTVHVAEESDTTPAPLALDPPHPNPFNPQTTLSFTLPEAGFARLAVYNLGGQLVRELTAETLPAGQHEIVWDGRNANGAAVASGVYIARLAVGGRSAVRKVTLVR